MLSVFTPFQLPGAFREWWCERWEMFNLARKYQGILEGKKHLKKKKVNCVLRMKCSRNRVVGLDLCVTSGSLLIRLVPLFAFKRCPCINESQNYAPALRVRSLRALPGSLSEQVYPWRWPRSSWGPAPAAGWQSLSVPSDTPSSCLFSAQEDVWRCIWVSQRVLEATILPSSALNAAKRAQTCPPGPKDAPPSGKLSPWSHSDARSNFCQVSIWSLEIDSLGLAWKPLVFPKQEFGKIT